MSTRLALFEERSEKILLTFYKITEAHLEQATHNSKKWSESCDKLPPIGAAVGEMIGPPLEVFRQAGHVEIFYLTPTEVIACLC